MQYQNASNVTIRDLITNRTWTYSASQVNRVDVYGKARGGRDDGKGPANAKLVRMFGLGGNDTSMATAARC